MGLQVAYARWLGVVEYGIFALVSSAVALAANLLVLGVPRAHLLLTPSYGAGQGVLEVERSGTWKKRGMREPRPHAVRRSVSSRR